MLVGNLPVSEKLMHNAHLVQHHRANVLKAKVKKKQTVSSLQDSEYIPFD